MAWVFGIIGILAMCFIPSFFDKKYGIGGGIAMLLVYIAVFAGLALLCLILKLDFVSNTFEWVFAHPSAVMTILSILFWIVLFVVISLTTSKGDGK